MIGMGTAIVRDSTKQADLIPAASIESLTKPLEKQLVIQPTRNDNKYIKIQRLHKAKVSYTVWR